MRVFYDGIVFQNSYQRGIQRAFRELIEHLPDEVDSTIALSAAARVALPRRGRILRTSPRLTELLPRGLRKNAQSIWSARVGSRLAAAHDCFHSTYYTLPPRDMPTVLHVHDLIPELHPEHFDSEWARAEISQRARCIRHATWIIAISQTTAEALASLYPEAARKVTTIYFGADHLLRGADTVDARRDSHGATRYALFVGDRAGYKNFSAVLEAVGSRQWPRELSLTVCGPPWRDSELEAIKVHNMADRVRHVGRASDSQLAMLYNQAACVLIPSLAEGFGFPVIEAQHAGAPLICNDIPILREVAGAGALFVSANDATSWALGAARLMDPVERGRIMPAARANLTRFSWSRCAAETASVYRDAIGAHAHRSAGRSG